MAEVVSLAANVMQVVDFTYTIYQTFHSGTQGKSYWRPVLPPSTNECYLKVFDFSYAGDTSQRLVGGSNTLSTLQNDLESLPSQEATFRIYLVERSSIDDTTFYAHLHSRGFPTSTKPLDRAENTFEALSSQWRGPNATSYESTMYSFENVGRIHNTNYNHVNRSLAFLAGLIKMNMSIRIEEVAGADDKCIGMALPFDLLT
jgi:hypothetical protein